MTIHPRRPKALAQRLSLLKADTKLHLVSNQKPAVTRIHRRFAPDTPAGATPQHQTPASRLSPGTRALVAVLALVAILPNLALGAIFFLGDVNTPWSAPVRLPPNASSKPAPSPAVLSAPTMLEVTAGEDVIFPIALDGTDGVPSRSIISISGLPQGSTLSSGRPYGESEWNLKTDEIGDLHLALPVNASGDAKLTIKLVAPDGIIIADTGLILKIAPAKPAETHGSIEQTQGPGVNKERLTSPSVPTPSGDPVPLPSRRPVPTASHDVDAIWLRPLTFVNLREEPSPSAPVVSVVARGAKLRVIGRKGRWVQVTHSSSLKSGWVYAGNVTARWATRITPGLSTLSGAGDVLSERGTDMKLSWFARSKIAVEVLDDEILVTMPGTSFSIVYERSKDNQLVASSFSGRKIQDERNKVSFPYFLSLAWTAANEKAKELGWLGKVHPPRK